MKALDLYCGLGGWSDGLVLEGFEVMGIEINPEIASLYKHPVLVEDVRNLRGEQFPNYDLIVGSPPCRDFSVVGDVFGHTWKRPPDPEGKGMELVNAFLRVVKDANPKFWLMENVPRLADYFENPRFSTYLGVKHMKRSFWGNFPAFLVPKDAKKVVYAGHWDKNPHRDNRPKMSYVGDGLGKHKKWLIAKIPLTMSRALGRAVKEELNIINLKCSKEVIKWK